MRLRLPEVEASYTARDTMLYALSIGLGADPTDPRQLGYVYERNLRAMPTMAAVLAHPGLWMRDLQTGIDYQRVVHGEEGLVIHRPLPVAARVVSRSRVVEVIDKGAGKGALLIWEKALYEAGTETLLATVRQGTFCRGDGGFSGSVQASPRPHPLPERAPDLAVELATLPQMALIYRLNADMNPLHADPEFAAGAGFPRPILHGLATYGVAAHAVVRGLCDYDASALRTFDCRFTAPVYPGETLRTEIWQDGAVVSFRVVVVERDVIAISNGRAELNSM